jgi:hypothetical protein
MDQVQVQVVQAESLQRLLEGALGVVLTGVGDPQLVITSGTDAITSMSMRTTGQRP